MDNSLVTDHSKSLSTYYKRVNFGGTEGCLNLGGVLDGVLTYLEEIRTGLSKPLRHDCPGISLTVPSKCK